MSLPETEPGFTPGQWTAEWDDSDGPTGWPTISSHGVEIVGIEGFYGPTIEAAKANAVLCSAAPELYAYAEAEEKALLLWEIGNECHIDTRPQSDYWDALAEYFPTIAEQCPLHTREFIFDWFGEEKSAEDARWDLYYLSEDADSSGPMVEAHLISLRTAVLAKARGEAQP